MKAKESQTNDQRLKFVNDMVTGARTTKGFGWENHFLEKLETIRKTQVKYVLY
jgi:hypothetical protein